MPKMTMPFKWGGERTVDAIDLIATAFSDKPGLAVAAVNKDPETEHTLRIPMTEASQVTVMTLNGDSKDAYNDHGHEGVRVTEADLGMVSELGVTLPPHSVSVIRIG